MMAVGDGSALKGLPGERGFADSCELSSNHPTRSGNDEVCTVTSLEPCNCS